MTMNEIIIIGILINVTLFMIESIYYKFWKYKSLQDFYLSIIDRTNEKHIDNKKETKIMLESVPSSFFLLPTIIILCLPYIMITSLVLALYRRI